MKIAFLVAAFLPAFSAWADSGYEASADENAAFYQAAKADDVSQLKKLLAKGAVINAQDSQGYTALIYAAYHGNAKAVNFLLEKGADPCKGDKRGNTAMMGAIFKGHLRIAKTLLQSKCSVEQANTAEQTPLMYAALFGRQDIAKELLKKGADADRQDVLGNDARSLAEGQGNTDMVRLLEPKKDTKK